MNLPSTSSIKLHLDEGFMFPGLYDGLFHYEVNKFTSGWNVNKYLSSGYCLSSIKNFKIENENIFTDRMIPCIKPPFKNVCVIDCISFNSPNILRKKRGMISIG